MSITESPNAGTARRAVRQIFPLTPMQQGILFHTLSAPDASLYLQQQVLDITGIDDPDILRAGLADLVARHPTLRTAVLADAPGRPLQAVLAHAELAVDLHELRGRPVEVGDEHAGRLLTQDLSRPFDLSRPPLLRVHAVRVTDSRWLLATTSHHIVLDGWSESLLLADLAELLDARVARRAAGLAPVRGFDEFVRWLESHEPPDPEARYRELLGDLGAATGLGVDRVGRWAPDDDGADRDSVVVLRDVSPGDPLQRLCRERGLLPSTLVHAAWGLLLRRYTDHPDVVFGATVSGRPAELPDASRRVGMFVNTVPVRVRIDEDRAIGDWLREVQDQLIAARDYEHVPLAVAQRCSAVPASRPLFETVVAFQNYWQPEQDRLTGGAGSVTVAVRERRERTSLPIAAAVAMPGRHVWVRLDFDRRRLDQPTAERMADDYARLIRTLAVTDLATPIRRVPVLPTDGADPPAAERLEVDEVFPFPLAAGDRVLAALDPADPALGPLEQVVRSAGATLDLRDPLLPGSPGSAGDATVVVGPPVAVAALVSTGGVRGVRVAVTGEPPQSALLRALLSGGATVYRLLAADPAGLCGCVPLRSEADGTALGVVPGARLIDSRGRTVAEGAAGRLVVAESPTGIVARLEADGGLRQLGRADAVDSMDTDWVSALLAADPGVTEAVVVRTNGVLVGWVVCPSGAPWDADAVLDRLRRTVPPELLPAELRRVPWLPRTASGAVDRAGLSAADTVPSETDPKVVRPPDAVQLRLDALPSERRKAFLDGLRTAQRAGAGPRRHRGAVPVSFAQSDWRARADRMLRTHGSVPAPEDSSCPDDRVTVTTGPDATQRWLAEPDVLDVASLAALAEPGAPQPGTPKPDPLTPDDHAGRRSGSVPARGLHEGAPHTNRRGSPDDQITATTGPDATPRSPAEPGAPGLALSHDDHAGQRSGSVPARGSYAGPPHTNRGESPDHRITATTGPDATPRSPAEPGAPGLALSHDDYAGWQAGPRRAGARAAASAYWRRTLAGVPRSTWATDPVPPGTTGVGEVSVREPETPTDPAIWLAAIAVAVGMLGGDEEVVLAVSARPDLPPELAGAPGPYARPLPVRLPAEPGSGIGPLVAEAADRLAEACRHIDVPYAELAELLAGPLLCGVAVHDGPDRLAAHGDVAIGVDIAPYEGGHQLTAVFDRSRVHPETATTLLRRAATLAKRAVSVPDTPVTPADLLTGDEEKHLLAWSAGQPTVEAPATVPELIAARLAEDPAQVAIDGPDGAPSYAELWRLAGGLATRLHAAGVGVDSRVGVCLPRSTALAWVPLGIMRAGAAYVPIDPTYPPDRARFICRDAATPLVVTVAELADRFDVPTLAVDVEPPDPSDPDHAALARPDSAAYVLYTSGSTGTPKGVVVEHRAVTDFCRQIAVAYGIDRHTRLLAFAALTFDVSVFDLWAGLAAGATVVLAGDEERLSVDRLRRLLVERRVTAAELPPALLPLLDPAELPELRLVSVGGEAPAGGLVDTWATPDREFWNGYGPTETTVAVTLMRCEPPSGGRVPPIGRPMPNHRAYVLDPAGQLLPIGVPGELCVGGAGLARGYLGQPGLTAAKFVPDPYAGVPGARMYRTGDLVRFTHDGVLEFLGRVDRQVKLRGFRVELGEVEAVLADQPWARQVVVEPWTDQAGTAHLTAYLVPAEPDRPPRLADLREAAGVRLPDYMVPTRLAILDRVPLTPTGKLDRSALPAPPEPAPAGAEAGREAVDDTEWTDVEREVAAEIFAPLLGLRAVGRTDDFFGLGGNSLQAIQVTSRVRERFGVELALADLFAEPTVATVARLVTRAQADAEEPREAAEAPRPRHTMATGALVPASYPQLALWQADRADGSNPRHNAPFHLRLRGPLDLDALRRSFALLAERHPTLRATFTELDGTLMQRIGEPGSVDWRVIDVPGADDAERERTAAQLVATEADRTFDLAEGPLLRLRVYRLGADDHVVQWTIHHTATDAWSIGIQLTEVGAAYEAYRQGTEPALPPLAADYAEFVDWHRDYVAGPGYVVDREWWADELTGLPPLRLPTDRPRDGHRFVPGYLNLALPDQLGERVLALCREANTTLYMTTLTAYATMLGALAGTDDVPIVTPNALRVRQPWEDLVGWFANRMILRIRLDDASPFTEQLAAVKATALAAFAHQAAPFELLRADLGLPDAALGACYSLQNAPLRSLGPGLRAFEVSQLPDLSGRDFMPIAEVYAPIGVKYECSVVLRQRPDGRIADGMEYDAGLVDERRAKSWRAAFLTILEAVAADPNVSVAALRRLVQEVGS